MWKWGLHQPCTGYVFVGLEKWKNWFKKHRVSFIILHFLGNHTWTVNAWLYIVRMHVSNQLGYILFFKKLWKKIMKFWIWNFTKWHKPRLTVISNVIFRRGHKWWNSQLIISITFSSPSSTNKTGNCHLYFFLLLENHSIFCCFKYGFWKYWIFMCFHFVVADVEEFYQQCDPGLLFCLL